MIIKNPKIYKNKVKILFNHCFVHPGRNSKKSCEGKT